MYRRLGTDLTAGMIDVQQEFGSTLRTRRAYPCPSVNNQVLPDTSAANGALAAVTCGCARVEYLRTPTTATRPAERQLSLLGHRLDQELAFARLGN